MSRPRIFLTENDHNEIMSEQKLDSLESVDNSCVKDIMPVENDDVIDVVEFDFYHDVDEWLDRRMPCSLDLSNDNMYIWLKSVPQLELSSDHGNKKCIDTRTFTRPKKKSIRMSFDSIFETLGPSTTSPQKPPNFKSYATGEELRNCMPTMDKLESVPPMLRPSLATAGNYLPGEGLVSGQESFEAFLHMSQSKGVDSFMNLTDSEFKEIMNISQPSLLYSSIMSTTKDESNMESEPISLEAETKPDETVLSSENSRDNTVLENTCYFNADEMPTNISNSEINLNETFDAGNVSIILSHSPVAHAQKGHTTDLPTKFVLKCNEETILLDRDDVKEGALLDDTYQVPEKKSVKSISPINKFQDTHVQKLDATKTIPSRKLALSPKAKTSNETYISNNEPDLNSTFAVDHLSNPATKADDALNSTFKVNPNQGNLPPRQGYNNLYSKLKAPTSLRKELLTEVQRSGAQSLDVTYNHVSDEQPVHGNVDERTDAVCDSKLRNAADIPIGNKYNTYKKGSLKEPVASQIDLGNRNMDDANERKYYTFTKKTTTSVGKMDAENAVPHENMDATFCKPSVKPQKKKLHAPRMSRLPQFLQKSNPNLVSNSLKTANVTGSSSIPNIGCIKPSQRRNTQGTHKAVMNNFGALGKAQSSSVHRLLEPSINVTDFHMVGAGGSMESIESTQSAHSAPDLDDRLSICSDISHNSYSTRPMNIEQLHQIVRMQEENLKQESTPKPFRRVLENNWMDEKKDMPSPILKNGVQNLEGDSNSPLSLDATTIISSSPIDSIESSQSINDGNVKENLMQKQADDRVITKQEAIISKPIENKTRLRQPTNWKAGNRPATVASGIPRPQSRIPAPRFTGANVKPISTDVNKRHL